MKTHKDRLLILMFLSWLLLAMMACNILPNTGGAEVTPTVTLTASIAPIVDKTKTSTPVVSGLMTPEITLTPNRCKGMSGELEMKILVGPAAAVGLEPFSVGQIPFTVTSQDPYTMQGKTHLSYAKTMNYSWGTYTVSLEMDANLTGECEIGEGGNSLNMVVTLTGEQNFVVVYHQATQTYPWKGTATLNPSFPIQEGANAQGEGWIFILHLK